MRAQDFERKFSFPQADQIFTFLGCQIRFFAELFVEGVEFFFERIISRFFVQLLPTVAKPDGSFGITELKKMTLDRVAMDLQGFRGLNDIAVINHEPVQKIMAVQVLREDPAFP